MDGRQPPVLWTDKELFSVQATHYHQNNRIYAVNKEDIPLNERIAYKHQKAVSVMVWAGVTSTGEKTPLIFVEEGVKLNQHVDQNMMKEQLVPCINAAFRESGITPSKTEPHPTLLILSKSGTTRIWQVSGQRSYGLLHRT